ncbi:MAG: VUT family protein [Bacteroidaceae bacterium]|nr:VUT family protein [Bacteroidaceae bacterium]
MKTIIRYFHTFISFMSLPKGYSPMAFAILVLSVVSMNLLANKELFHTSWVALDCGFALSWIPFLIMDSTCKVYGGRTAARISILALGINLITFFVFKLIVMTPGAWGEYYATGLDAVNVSIGNTIGGSTWIVLGSALAMFVSSIVNSAVNVSVARLMKRRDGYGAFAVRSFTSTAIAQFVDNLVFALVVSIPLFGWNMTQALFCSVTAALFELTLEVCFSGVGYRMAKRWEK